MKVAALAPQFTIVAPEGEESKDAARVHRQLSVVKTDAASDAGGEGGGAQQETRDGLKRLAQFISGQRRAPDHEKPEASTPELRERPASDDSHEFTKILLQWSRRPRVINSMAQVFADEKKRRHGLKVYKRMQAVTKKLEQKPHGEVGGLPALLEF
ncbi:MAG: hypothetical protein V4760_06585 [Bdellovibrionota bacterium]